jgi:hypothetical protein
MIDSIMSLGYTQAVNFTPSQSSPPSTIAAEDTTGTDTVNISSEANHKLSVSPFSSTGSTTISFADIEKSLADTTSYVEDRLRSLYSKLGISSSSKMDISVGYDGSILVKGESPAAESLAQKINADDELSNSIRKMSADASLLEAAKEHEEFAAAYAKNPQAALERYGYLFDDDRSHHVSFSMQDGKLSTTIDSF